MLEIHTLNKLQLPLDSGAEIHQALLLEFSWQDRLSNADSDEN